MTDEQADVRRAKRTRIERRRGPRWKRRALTERRRHDQRSVDYRDPHPVTPAEWLARHAEPVLPPDRDRPDPPGRPFASVFEGEVEAEPRRAGDRPPGGGLRPVESSL